MCSNVNLQTCCRCSIMNGTSCAVEAARVAIGVHRIGHLVDVSAVINEVVVVDLLILKLRLTNVVQFADHDSGLAECGHSYGSSSLV